jgi:molecular chaperone GrpE
VSASKKHIHTNDHSHSKSHKTPESAEAEWLGDACDAHPEDEPCEGQDITLSDRELLVEQIDRMEKENKDLSDRLLRTMAEFDNYRKRVAREKDDLLKYGAEKMALDMLPVADSFERALEQAKTAADAAAVIEGVHMIFKQFLATLEKFNIKPFDSVGQPFDPEKHEAMAQQEHPEYTENTVMGELQKGYFLNDKLLRPARVVVSRGPDDSSGMQEEE